MNKHLFYKKFSFPINMDMINNNEIDINWFIKYQDLINDIYLPPFFDKEYTFDAHKGIPYDYTNIKEFINKISKTSIKINIIYNDLLLTEEEHKNNIKKFKENIFKYNLKEITIVDKFSEDWFKLKEDFDFLTIKYSMTNNANLKFIKKNINYLKKFDLIYSHGDILNNYDKYYEFLETNNLKIGTVINFYGCSAKCTKIQDHYKDFKLYKGNAQPIIDSYCPFTNQTILQKQLKTTRLPNKIIHYKKFLNILSIYKLQSRHDIECSRESKKIIEDIFELKPILYSVCEPNIKNIDKIKWANYIQNCGGNCLSCSYCDDIEYRNTNEIKF